jgi:hypothetical protein
MSLRPEKTRVMKRLIVTPLTIALCAGMVLAQEPAASGKSAEVELKQIENSWSDAQKTRNVDKLLDILADEWVGLAHGSRECGKRSRVAGWESGFPFHRRKQTTLVTFPSVTILK